MVIAATGGFRRPHRPALAGVERFTGSLLHSSQYPAGRFDATVVAAVRAAGYRGATTVIAGVARPGHDPHELSRIRISRGESAAAVSAAVGRG